MDDALTLYQIQYTMDAIGNQIPVRTPREVYARVERYSIYRTYSPSDSDRIELYLTERSGVKGDD